MKEKDNEEEKVCSRGDHCSLLRRKNGKSIVGAVVGISAVDAAEAPLATLFAWQIYRYHCN